MRPLGLLPPASPHHWRLHAQRAAEAMETPDSVHISHEPYSYVVPGKLTVIKAIISREAVQSVRCRFRSLDKGGYASVAMAKAPGSQFTYVATLPALKPGAAALSYRFIVIGASGIQTFSQEFVYSGETNIRHARLAAGPRQRAGQGRPGESLAAS